MSRKSRLRIERGIGEAPHVDSQRPHRLEALGCRRPRHPAGAGLLGAGNDADGSGGHGIRIGHLQYISHRAESAFPLPQGAAVEEGERNRHCPLGFC